MTTMSEEALLAQVEKMVPEVKAVVVAALRSGEYEQGQGYLGHELEGPVKHCCLGVMCEEAIKAGVEVTKRMRSGTSAIYAYGGNTSLPPAQVVDWLWGRQTALRIPYVDTNDDGEEVLELTEFVHLNDDVGLTFEQIADLIEEYL